MANDHIADDRKKVRLIDANALLEDFGEEPLVWNDGEAEIQERSDWHRYRVLVKLQPTVSAVEVCRCKDCKHGCEDHEDAYLCNNAYYGLMGFTRGEDFCSYGERRTEDDHHRTE